MEGKEGKIEGKEGKMEGMGVVTFMRSHYSGSGEIW